MSDDYRLLPRYRGTNEAAEREKRVARAVIGSGNSIPKATQDTNLKIIGADRVRLRGIPVIGTGKL